MCFVPVVLVVLPDIYEVFSSASPLASRPAETPIHVIKRSVVTAASCIPKAYVKHGVVLHCVQVRQCKLEQ